MARITIDNKGLRVRLNFFERVMALRGNVHVPLKAVESVEVQARPLSKTPAIEVEMGFAASTAPASRVATVGPRAKFCGGRALLIVWRNARSVVVLLSPNESKYRLLIVSDRNADSTAEAIRVAAPLVDPLPGRETSPHQAVRARFLKDIPATSYSPRELPPKYHRR